MSMDFSCGFQSFLPSGMRSSALRVPAASRSSWPKKNSVNFIPNLLLAQELISKIASRKNSPSYMTSRVIIAGRKFWGGEGIRKRLLTQRTQRTSAEGAEKNLEK